MNIPGKQPSESLLTYSSFPNKLDIGNQKFSLNGQQSVIQSIATNDSKFKS